MPLGLFENADFQSAVRVPLEPGEVVLLTTDGVAESKSPDGTLFGMQRAIDVVRIHQSSAAFEIVRNLFHAVRAFTHNSPQEDDITTVVVKVSDLP